MESLWTGGLAIGYVAPVPTAEQLRRLAEEAAADVERLTAERDAAIAEYDRLISIAMGQADELGKLAEMAGLLPNTETKRIIRTMDVNTHGSPVNVKRGAGRATRKHKAQKKLYEQGKTITDIAAELGEGRPRVSAWFADGEANRPIPRRHADKLRDKYGIPLTAWARIAD